MLRLLVCAHTGNMLFHGPREEVVPFFQSQGFYVPERKAVSDFLQEVTSKKDQKVSHSHCARFSVLVGAGGEGGGRLFVQGQG